MSIVNSWTVASTNTSGGFRAVTHYFEDHLTNEYEWGPRDVPDNWTETEWAIERNGYVPILESQLAQQEIQDACNVAQQRLNPDRVAEHQSQADFDRRLLGRMMNEYDPHVFLASHPFFQAVASRGGPNAQQRAAYLGVDKTTHYDPIADRYNSVSGVAWFLTDEDNAIWDPIPDEFL